MKAFDNDVRWGAVPTLGLPELQPLSGLYPFGFFPRRAFVLVNEMGQASYVPALYAFDAEAKRWRDLDFRGDARIGIGVSKLAGDRWVLVRRGYGAGGYALLQVAIVGADMPPPIATELPCTSWSSGPVEPGPDGGWALECSMGDDKRRLEFGPGSVEPK